MVTTFKRDEESPDDSACYDVTLRGTRKQLLGYIMEVNDPHFECTGPVIDADGQPRDPTEQEVWEYYLDGIVKFLA